MSNDRENQDEIISLLPTLSLMLRHSERVEATPNDESSISGAKIININTKSQVKKSFPQIRNTEVADF
jgi:hypothetical protein